MCVSVCACKSVWMCTQIVQLGHFHRVCCDWITCCFIRQPDCSACICCRNDKGAICGWICTICRSIVPCTEDFVSAPGLPSMHLHYGWKLQGLLQEPSSISTISFFINLTEIALEQKRHIHLIKSQNIALLFHFIIERHMADPTASQRDLILSQSTRGLRPASSS